MEGTKYRQKRVHMILATPAYQQLLETALAAAHAEVVRHSDALSFLSSARSHPLTVECVVTEVYLPDISGVEMQRRLHDLTDAIPVIFCVKPDCGLGEVIRAMKQGAHDVLISPMSPAVLADAVFLALEAASARLDHAELTTKRQKLYDRLSTREKEVAGLLAQGEPSKRIALELGISKRTVDVHRAHIYEKLEVESPARLALELSELLALPKLRIS